jgi:hypothetical protein
VSHLLPERVATRPAHLLRLLVAASLALALSLPCAAVAETPTPSASGGSVVPGGDVRSEPEGPGLVGNPLVVALGVAVLGVVCAGVTLAYVRLTRDP